jgi:hypothetical protein
LATTTSTATPSPRLDADRPAVSAFIKAIEDLRGSRVLTYYLHENDAAMAMDAMPAFYDQLRAIGKQDKLDLWLHSTGGQTEMPWRLVQTLRCYCKRLGVLVTELPQARPRTSPSERMRSLWVPSLS